MIQESYIKAFYLVIKERWTSMKKYLLVLLGKMVNTVNKGTVCSNSYYLYNIQVEIMLIIVKFK